MDLIGKKLIQSNLNPFIIWVKTNNKKQTLHTIFFFFLLLLVKNYTYQLKSKKVQLEPELPGDDPIELV